jgi:hypothetical protein
MQALFYKAHIHQLSDSLPKQKELPPSEEKAKAKQFLCLNNEEDSFKAWLPQESKAARRLLSSD